MLSRAGLVSALLVAVFAVAEPARGGDTFPGPNITRPGPNAERGARALQAAQAAVARRWPACRIGGPPREVTFTDAPVPADLAGALGVLRRPQTAAEAAIVAGSPAVPAFGYPATDVVRSSLRIVRTLADGTQIRLFAALTTPQLVARPEVCRIRELRELRRRVRSLPAQARRAALRQQRLWARIERRAAALPPRGPGLYLAAVNADGVGLGGFGGVTLADVRTGGPIVPLARRGQSLLLGIAPDGVSRVDVVLARGRSPFTGRYYPTTLRASGAVVDNVVVVPVRRPIADALVMQHTFRATE